MLNESMQSQYAVADAMMIAQEYFLDIDHLKYSGESDLNAEQFMEKIDNHLEKRSFHKCTYGSLKTITYLQQRFPDVFNYLFLMTFDNRNLYYPNSDLAGFTLHTVFMAQAKEDGMWFAGSPANYGKGNIDYMTDVMAGENLDSIVNQIKTRTPGKWQEPKDIERLLTVYKPPLVDDSHEFALEYSHLHRYKGTDKILWTDEVVPPTF